MGKKYIIELEDNESVYKTVHETIIANKYPILQVIAPAHYTEPDLEQVRNESFKNGYDAACKNIDIKSKTNAAYRKGLEDAWEWARKICAMDSRSRDKSFGAVITATILEHNSASEAIEKIRQYEQEQEEIQVGDEIETPSGLKGYVVNFTDDELVHYVSSEGRFGTMGMSAVSKTGRNFPEIAEVLAKMKETE